MKILLVASMIIDAPKISEWKSNAITQVSLEFNGSVETMHDQLHDEISYINQKIKDACGSENFTYKD